MNNLQNQLSKLETKYCPSKYHPELHIVCTSAIAYGSSSISLFSTKSKILSIILGTSAGLTASVLKELFDKSCGYDFNWKDIGYGTIGTAIGESIFYIQFTFPK
jgi:hypothetical protein